MRKLEKESPPAAATAEGRCIPWEDNASQVYPPNAEGSKLNKSAQAAHSAHAREEAPEPPLESHSGACGSMQPQQAVLCDSAGRKRAYRGKRARVVELLVTMPQGVTQWDTLPWHTRLGGTIHALRQDGLDISTELEGPYRHARYRLHTSARLLLQVGNRQEPVLIHRVAQ